MRMEILVWFFPCEPFTYTNDVIAVLSLTASKGTVWWPGMITAHQLWVGCCTHPCLRGSYELPRERVRCSEWAGLVRKLRYPRAHRFARPLDIVSRWVNTWTHLSGHGGSPPGKM